MGGGETFRHTHTTHSLHCCQVAYFWATQLKSNGGGDNAFGQNMSGLQLIVFICKKFHARFTVPPTVALLNYISCGILWRIFAKLEHFAGFSLRINNMAVRIS
jgi:hypothetical protein